MEDTSVAPPYKYTDIRREILALLVEMPKDKPRQGKDMFAFNAVVPICSEIHVEGVAVTFWSDCAYSASLSKKIGKSPLAWWFWYLHLVQGYNLSTVQSLMESFDTQQALLSKFSSFDPVTLEVDCEIGDVDDQLEGIEAYLGINQGWVADNKDCHGQCFLPKVISRHWRICFKIVSMMLTTQLAVAPLTTLTFLN